MANHTFTRENALTLMHKHVQSPGLRKHMLAVEAAMVDYAQEMDGDPHAWGLAGLLHDFDWELHPTAEEHPVAGVPILRTAGVPEDVIEAILGHADHSGIPRTTLMARALYACDEITGLITAAALIRPSRSILDLEVRSVRKKWKNPRFAASVDRQQIEAAAEEFGVDLWGSHVAHVIQSMRRIAADLDLAGNADAG